MIRIAALLAWLLLASAWGAAAQAQSPITCQGPDLQQDLAATFAQQGTTRVLALRGGIVRGSSKVVAAAMNSGQPYDQIWLCSGGGLVDEGFEIGKLFSRAKAWVRVPAGFFCASSCTIMTLGGYLRTIDDGADFVVHASSGVLEFADDGLFGGDCENSQINFACREVASALVASSLQPCKGNADFEDANDPCDYLVAGSATRIRFFMIKSRPFLRAVPEREVFAKFARFQLEDSVASTIELLKYYQRMLNDGNEYAVNSSAYSAIQAENAGIADTYESGARNLSEDLASLSAASPDQRPVVWQEIITQIELYARRGVYTAMEPQAARLGRGGKAALKLLDAMTRCRIQSACYLDANSVAELGYANFEIQ